MGSRLHGIIAKEFTQLLRDRLALTLMLFVPVAMLFIFGWAINTDVKHVPTAVFDQSGSVEAPVSRAWRTVSTSPCGTGRGPRRATASSIAGAPRWAW